MRIADKSCLATPKAIKFAVSGELIFQMTLRLLSLFPSQLGNKPIKMEKIFTPKVSETSENLLWLDQNISRQCGLASRGEKAGGICATSLRTPISWSKVPKHL